MNAAQIHLALNHLPVFGPLFATPILAIGCWLDSSPVRKVGLWLLLFSALSAIPVYLSGAPTEDLVKNYPGVSELAIHQHQRLAFTALIMLEITGAASLVYLILAGLGKPVPRPAWWLVIAAGLATFGIAAQTAHLGGLIRHEEIQSGAFLQPGA